jgi:hypothetical protein
MRILRFSLSLLPRLIIVTYSGLLAAQQQSITAEESTKLKSFLREYLHDSYAAGDTATRYFATFVDLTDAGKQAIVYFTTAVQNSAYDSNHVTAA